MGELDTKYDPKYLTHRFETASTATIGALSIGSWDVPRINAAREAHQLGRFVLSAGFAQALKRDSRVFGAWAQRSGAPLSLARAIEPPKGLEGDELAESARAEAEALFAEGSSTCPLQVLSTIFERVPVHGFTWLQNVWTPRPDGSRIDVRVVPWPTQAVYFDTAADEGRGGYKAITADGTIDLKHGDGKWIGIEPYGLQSYLSGALIPAALCFADRGWGIRDRANFSGAHGSPGVIGKLPKDEAPEGELGQAYLAEMAKLQQPRARMLEPDGANTRYIEATSQNHQIFGQIINGEATDIAVAFLGQDGTSQNSGGTYTKALVLLGVLLDLLAKDCSATGTALSTGLLLPFTAVNRGRVDIAPALRWLVPRPIEDARQAEAAARSTSYAAEVQAYRALGIPVDEQRLAVMRGVSIPILPGAAWPTKAAPQPSALPPLSPNGT